MRLVYVSLILLVAGVALAQRPTADQVRRTPRGAAGERFHEAAGLFVAGDTIAAALAAREGLRLAPEDPALRALLAAIERRPPPQQPRGGGDDERRPPPPDESEGAGDNPNTDAPNDGSERRAERPPDEPGDRGNRARRRPHDGQAAGEAAARANAARPPRMTPAEAEALLRALGADERRLLRARAGQVEPREVENEW